MDGDNVDSLNLIIPNPITHKRNRTLSQSEQALQLPVETGVIASFCRSKGHGFVKPDNGGSDLFLHIFDIEGEFVPHEGDIVEYRSILIPPKNEKYQAVHCRITNLAPGHHEMWDENVKS